MTQDLAGSAAPRLPPIRLRIGVSGHREAPKLPEELIAAVRVGIDRILAAVQEAARQYAGSQFEPRDDRPLAAGQHAAPSFAVVSSLAEGSDRLVADAGLAAAFALEAVLPLPRAEYQRDFDTGDSRAEFMRLLDRATSVFELDGQANERPRAYEAAGFVVLANVDLLIAIWDGKAAEGLGGTAQIVSRAIADGMPIVWIDPAQPDILRLSWSRPGELPPANANARPWDSFETAEPAEIATAVTDILTPPTQSEAQLSLQRYLRERERRWNFCPWFPLLQWAFSGRRPRWRDLRLPNPLSETRAQWQEYFGIIPADTAQRPAIEAELLPAYSAADHLAIFYSLIYRSTYVFVFLFAAVAVALALGGIFTHDVATKTGLVAAELVVIGTILFTWLRGHRRQWHRRWLDYRRLAECLRHMRILAPVGSGGPIDRPGRSLDPDEQDWINWYAWSVRRLIPLPNRTVDTAYVAAVRDAVRFAEIAGQLRYHAGNAQQIDSLDHHLHRAGQWLFGATGVLCLGFLAVVAVAKIAGVDPTASGLVLELFTFATALLPTLGAAIGAIHVQGDFKTVAEQSKRTAKRLAAIDKVLADEPPALARLTDRIEKTSDVMMADLLEWQTVFRTRPLSLPA